jgi:hypothetical protein
MKKCSEGLGFHHLDVHSPRNVFIKKLHRGILYNLRRGSSNQDATVTAHKGIAHTFHSSRLRITNDSDSVHIMNRDNTVIIQISSGCIFVRSNNGRVYVYSPAYRPHWCYVHLLLIYCSKYPHYRW